MVTSRIKTGLLLLTVIVLASGCGQKVFKEKDKYYSFLGAEENGLIKSREVNGIKMEARLLPPDFLASQDMIQDESLNYEDQKKEYASSLTFVLNINTSDKSQGSLMMRNVRDYSEYKERNLALNFDLNKDITLKVGDKDYAPAIVEFENTYDLTRDRNVYIVFNLDLEKLKKEGQDLDLTFEDNHFGTGLNHFQFSGSDIQNIPTLQL